MITIGDAIDRDVLRIRHDFLDLPALVLTAAQTARLHALSTEHAKALLESLVLEGFLMRLAEGSYARRDRVTFA